jgi:putative acyl-CoA dehydrogenase
MATHEVLNQPPPLAGYDVFGEDRALVEAVEREGAGFALEELHELGRLAGSEEAIDWGVKANASPPVLRTHDRFGHRIDEVEYHPAYHQLMTVAVAHGLHAGPWRTAGPSTRQGAHVARAAGFLVWSQVDAGHGCPVSMTYAVVPALRAAPEVAAEWEPRLLSSVYDRRSRPATEKDGALAGMAMTEKQGGSDVRANTTVASPLGGDEYVLTGHKWFCSAPMGDLFLVLAQAPGGLSCFALPRWTPDGARNGFHLQRLKDKLGNRSNASSEVEFDQAWARLVGPEGRGVPTIIEMVNHTRLDCVLGQTALMRQAVAQATHHAAHRRAFGAELIDQPLMVNVLADLAVESEAATITAMRLARAYDAGPSGAGGLGAGSATGSAEAGSDAGEAALRRLATAVAKYWICKRGPAHAAEALECLGGNGYVEESPMPRLLRESPLNGIWEGSGNVICLDVLRAMTRQPVSIEAFLTEVRAASGADRRLDAFVGSVEGELADLNAVESRARRLVERMALAWQGSLMVRHGHPAVADAFVASRLSGDWGRAFGTLPPGLDLGAIIDRARPKV